ncbi:MAG: hypothetical protein BWK80_31765 [Desulfobacteraceae bacterium IS3]|nr:MAG: hypothetical protein BWK80_31765 [Desulfobacteraceae bacterium IS3]
MRSGLVTLRLFDVGCLKNRVSPGGTFENSPAVHCRVSLKLIYNYPIPAINCRAIIGCPSGTENARMLLFKRFIRFRQ